MKNDTQSFPPFGLIGWGVFAVIVMAVCAGLSQEKDPYNGDCPVGINTDNWSWIPCSMVNNNYCESLNCTLGAFSCGRPACYCGESQPWKNSSEIR